MTFGPRPCSNTSPATLAPATVGLPSVGASPPTTSTSPNSTTSPGLPGTRATCSLSSRATRYCLPPVLMTANIVFILVFDPGARRIRTGFLAVGLCLGSGRPGAAQTHTRAAKARAAVVLMAADCPTVKEWEIGSNLRDLRGWSGPVESHLHRVVARRADWLNV